MRVLVTDSDTRSALAVVRSLGRAGHHVVTTGSAKTSLAAASRFSSNFERSPNPLLNCDGFVDSILGIIRAHRIQLLLPTTEVTTLLLSENSHLLPESCTLPFPGFRSIELASNKAAVMSIAEKLGVPIPKTIEIGSALDDRIQNHGFSWPVVVKPSRSRFRWEGAWLSTRVRYATSDSDLRTILSTLPQGAYPVLLQERIEGAGSGVFACFEAGKPVALFAHKRLREKPPSGGVSVLCESAPLDPLAVEYATRLLAALDWRGVAMVEFKRDDRNNCLKLMEINARFWGSLQLAITAGVNFPVLLAEMAAGNVLQSPRDYRIGVRSRWLAGDLDALFMLLTRSRARLKLPHAFPGRLRSALAFLTLRGTDLHYEIEQLDDLGPAWLEWGRRLRLLPKPSGVQ